MEQLHDYSYQCICCDLEHETNSIDLYLIPNDYCPACDVKCKWDYLSTLMKYKIGTK